MKAENILSLITIKIAHYYYIIIHYIIACVITIRAFIKCMLMSAVLKINNYFTFSVLNIANSCLRLTF